MTVLGVLALALAAVSPSTGLRSQLPPAPLHLYRIAWQRPFVGLQPLETGPQERGGVAVDPQRGIAFVGTRDGWLHAVRRDGSVLWEVRGEGGGFGLPLVDGDTVYVGSADGRLYAVAIPTGQVRWTYDAREDVSTRPALAGGTVVVASLQDTVFGVDAATGAWRWHHRRERRAEGFTIFGAASVQVAGGTAFAAYSDGFVAALDVKTGTARWERRIAPAGPPGTAQLDVDALAHDGDRLYAAAYSGAVIALDPKTGQEVWTFQAPSASQVVVAPGMVVAVTATSVVGLSPVSGAPLWTTPLDGSPSGPPVLAGKWLMVPAGKGGLRWLEAASGRLLRVFDAGTGVFAPPGVGAGRVYVLSNGGALFALDLG
jgi:outer membrane protein assembly factor BamB